MNFSVEKAKDFFEIVRNSYPSPDAAKHFHMEIAGGMVRFFSTSGSDPTEATIDLESGILTTQCGFRYPEQGPNMILQQSSIPVGLSLRVGNYITFVSDDSTNLGRITGICARFRSQTTSMLGILDDKFSYEAHGKGDQDLYLLDPFFPGREKMFRISAGKHLYETYREFMLPLVKNSADTSFFLEMWINLEYGKKALVKNPFRPEEICLKAKFISISENVQYSLKIIND